MKNSKSLLLLLLVFFIGFSSCKKKKFSVYPEISAGTLDLGSEIKTDFSVTIVDESGAPLNDVNIVVGDKSGSTDSKGSLTIEAATVKEKLAYITASKSGYFFRFTINNPNRGLHQ